MREWKFPVLHFLVLHFPVLHFSPPYKPPARNAYRIQLRTDEHTNKRINERTSKHDGSQYILADVIQRMVDVTADVKLYKPRCRFRGNIASNDSITHSGGARP